MLQSDEALECAPMNRWEPGRGRKRCGSRRRDRSCADSVHWSEPAPSRLNHSALVQASLQESSLVFGWVQRSPVVSRELSHEPVLVVDPLARGSDSSDASGCGSLRNPDAAQCRSVHWAPEYASHRVAAEGSDSDSRRGSNLTPSLDSRSWSPTKIPDRMSARSLALQRRLA